MRLGAASEARHLSFADLNESFRTDPGGQAPGHEVAENPHVSSRLAAGSIWGLLGQILTFAGAFVATPFVIRLLGAEGYATFALIQLVLTYLAVVDLGMGLASTRFAAAAHAKDDDLEESAVLWTALVVASLPTLAVALALLAAGGRVADLIGVAAPLHDEAAVALGLSAGILIARVLVSIASTPAFVRLRFGPYTLVWGGTAVAQSIGLPIALWVSPSLETAVLLVTTTTLGAAVLHGAIAMRLLPALRRVHVRRSLISPLVTYGAVSAATVLVETAISSGERLLLARLAPTVALGYFTVAFTMARLPSALPAAVGTVLLPTFARLHARGASTDLHRLYWQGTRLLALALLPPTAILIAVGGPVLHLWAGPEFAREGATALAVLSVAGFVDGVSYVPRVHLGAIGRPDRILRYHLVNLGPYLLISGLLVFHLGVLGAAIAWSLRAVVEAAQAFIAVGRLDPGLLIRLPAHWPAFAACLSPLVVATTMSLAVSDHLPLAALAVTCGIAVYVALSLRLLVSPGEREHLARLLRSAAPRAS